MKIVQYFEGIDFRGFIIRKKNKLFTQETSFKRTSYKMFAISEHWSS